MRLRIKSVCAIAGVVFLAAGAGHAKGRSELPAYVLQARTITVLIDPDAGISVEDPQANRVAQKDVEAALSKWGRYAPVITRQGADLIVVVRRGHNRAVDQTISDPRQNSRPGVITPTDDGVLVGGQRGRSPDLSNNPNTTQPGRSQTEIGGSDDLFTVFRGDVKDPLEGSPVWRYSAKDGLRSPSVPAVAEFKKAVAEAEKAAARKP